MYYKKIPADRPFILRAKAVIHDYFLNDQVSFGLMVRDDCYVDKTTADILGDYVAAGTAFADTWGAVLELLCKKKR